MAACPCLSLPQPCSRSVRARQQGALKMLGCPHYHADSHVVLGWSEVFPLAREMCFRCEAQPGVMPCGCRRRQEEEDEFTSQSDTSVCAPLSMQE